MCTLAAALMPDCEQMIHAHKAPGRSESLSKKALSRLRHFIKDPYGYAPFNVQISLLIEGLGGVDIAKWTSSHDMSPFGT
jgi:hypothetical protein